MLHISSKSRANGLQLHGTSRRISSLFLALAILSSLLAPSSSPQALAQSAPPPVLQSPANGLTVTATGYDGSMATPPVAIPEFRWSPVEGATSYRLELSQDIGFTNKIEFRDLSNPRYTPIAVNQFSDGIWYWRVRVDSPSTSEYSNFWSFTRTWASADNYPHLVAPLDGASLDIYSAPTFSWEPVMGAAQYRFQIASSTEFNPLLYDQYTLATAHQPSYKLANGTYFWRVIPLDPANREGISSPPWSFVQNYNPIPQLLDPADDTYPTFTPTFHWTAVEGTQFYRLQYSTDPSFNANVTTIDTRNTTYTPVNALPNDVNYYWRVRAHSGNSITDWSEVRNFRKQWYIQAKLLTPTNLYQSVRFPTFSWSPVPGASYYKVEYNTINSFPSSNAINTANTFWTPQFYDGGQGWRYWRVTPYDHRDNAGKPSEVSSYVSSSGFTAPDLIYPFYYYPPNNFPFPDENVATQPHSDRTAPLPVFIWQRVTEPSPIGGTYPDAYRIEISTSPLFSPIVWTSDTENLHAAPTTGNPFSPAANTDYYWRVCPLFSLGGACLENTNNGLPWWSQVWRARFDLTRGLPASIEPAPWLLRPAHSSEIVETTPLLEWRPKQGADSYEVQIGRASDFSEIVDSATVTYPTYSPMTSFAERHLGRLDYGTFYWRVRGRSGGSPIGSWSSTWRFQIASQSEWLRYRSVGNTNNRLQIASDPTGDTSASYDLSALHAAQSSEHWYFGFEAKQATSNVMYGLYVDKDHVDESGATTDPRSFSLSTTPAHRPEYAIYIWRSSSAPFSMSSDQVYVYEWQNSGWGPQQKLNEIGGQLFPNTLHALDMVSNSHALAVGNFGNIQEWNGLDWNTYYGPTQMDLYAIAENDTFGRRWAVGENGTILGWDYGVGGWQTMTSPTTNSLYAAQVVSSTLSIVMGSNGTILHWNGNGWTNPISPQNLPRLNSVHYVDSNPDYAWAVGDYGTILRWTYDTTDKRWEWNTFPSPTVRNLYSVKSVSPTEAWAVGEAGVVLRFNGVSWSATNPSGNTALYSVSVASSTNVWAVGAAGKILRWNGTTWNIVSSPTANDLHAVDMISTTDGMIVGGQGTNLRWNGTTWNVIQDPIGGVIEIKIPATAIGSNQENGNSYAISLFSANASAGSQPLDTVPSDPQVPGNRQISRFASTTERMALRFPLDTRMGDPTSFANIVPFFWEYPTGSFHYEPDGVYNTTPWAGATMEVHLDPKFTSRVSIFELTSNAAYYASTSHAWLNDFSGDNTYYWRIRPRYLDNGGSYLGTWSEGWSFERTGFIPTNLQESVSFATPTFTWDMVEGAEVYEIQVDNDPNYGSLAISTFTAQNSFTWNETLPNGTYYWRVRIRRNGSIFNEWSPSKTFVLTLPQPAGLSPNDPQKQHVVGSAPTLCWEPLIKYAEGIPILAAYKYKVQVSKGDTNFSPVYDNMETEQTCWTPTRGYDDGTYYWRVAMMDGHGKYGDYSPPAVFTKQYPTTTLISPSNGVIAEAPTFVWTAVNGAASYQLEVSQSITFNPLFESVTTNNVQYTPPRGYPNQHTYFWRVAIRDKENKIGPFNNATIILDPYGYANKLYLPFVKR